MAERRTEFFRQAQQGKRVQVYVELRDMWVGVFLPPTAVYLCVLGLVVRWQRTVRDDQVFGPGWQDAAVVDPFELAQEAIGLFLEYRDRHGHNEESARASAAREVAEGCAAEHQVDVTTAEQV